MNLNGDIFSDIFARHDNSLTRLDPRPKLLLSLILIICVICSGNALFPVVVLTGCLVSTRLLGVPVSVAVLRLLSPLAIVLTVVILQAVTMGETHLLTLDCGLFRIVFRREGLLSGLLTGSRAFGATSIILFLSIVTPAHQILDALRWMRVPHQWVEIAALMYRYLFALFELFTAITAAQRARLGYSGFRRSLRAAGIAAGTVIVKSMDQALRTHDAMILRGYSGCIPFGPLPQFSRFSLAIVSFGSLVILVLFVLCNGGIVR